MDIVQSMCEAGIMTKDLRRGATTVEVTNAVCDEIERRGSKITVGF